MPEPSSTLSPDTAELKACLASFQDPRHAAWQLAVLTCLVEALVDHHPQPAAVRATLRDRLARLHDDFALNDERGDARAAMDRFARALLSGWPQP